MSAGRANSFPRGYRVQDRRKLTAAGIVAELRQDLGTDKANDSQIPEKLREVVNGLGEQRDGALAQLAAVREALGVPESAGLVSEIFSLQARANAR